ncbi:hypothetical protein L195_g010841 [Trifolium pratense]|uniref:Uncharacterized protein n=1 Tax=Trifolium pratense TaxID=57577 RepID=A0A2K3PFT8_TRIPR|nr:hypothetical protein L195_g010841 [Trifolium pratense]
MMATLRRRRDEMREREREAWWCCGWGRGKRTGLVHARVAWFTGLTIDPAGSHRFSPVFKQNWFCMLTDPAAPPVPDPTDWSGF